MTHAPAHAPSPPASPPPLRSPLPVIHRGFGRTMRRDAWWVQPLVVFLVLTGFIVYATWAAFQNAYYFYGPYLSPFYSPEIFGVSPHAWFGPKPDAWPAWLPFSPALLILPFPAMFRLTCYYYRGAYYKAFWADPLSCSVGEARNEYRGERSFPLIMQNIHRYVLYTALVFLVILTYDAIQATLFLNEATGRREFGIGVGTLVLTTNVILLGGYTLGCHSLRHLVGGYRDRLAGRRAQRVAYDCATCLNQRHHQWAWASLVWVAFTDFYVRMCAMGVWTDWRIL